MPIAIQQKYKLSGAARKALGKYLRGEAGIQETADTLNTTRQRVYTMSSAIFRHAIAKDKIDVKAVLKDY